MKTIATARKLRRTQTDAEQKLWLSLRNRRLAGLKFRRQAPVAGFIADFLCDEAKLVIELDGSQHAENENDVTRTAALNAAGFEVLRFWNNEVVETLDGVLQRIVEAAQLAKSEAQP
jgi:very-short-patch-repair endonuclease